MEKKLITDIVLIILLVALISVLVYGIMNIKKEARECLASPVTYGIEKISEANDFEIECSCNGGLMFNRTTIIRRAYTGMPYAVGGLDE